MLVHLLVCFGQSTQLSVHALATSSVPSSFAFEGPIAQADVTKAERRTDLKLKYFTAELHKGVVVVVECLHELLKDKTQKT